MVQTDLYIAIENRLKSIGLEACIVGSGKISNPNVICVLVSTHPEIHSLSYHNQNRDCLLDEKLYDTHQLLYLFVKSRFANPVVKIAINRNLVGIYKVNTLYSVVCSDVKDLVLRLDLADPSMLDVIVKQCLQSTKPQ